MSKHKTKRIERVLGYTKASHKGAIIYFTKEKEERPIRSLKRKKVCKFTKGEHKFILIKEHESIFRNGNTWREYQCDLCGKLKMEW